MNQERPGITVPALLGGLLLGFTSAVPILNCGNCLCCAWIIAGGLLASYLYLQSYPSTLPPLTYGEGAVLGMLTGVIGGLIETIVRIPFTILSLHPSWQDMAEVREALSDPDVPPFLRDLVLIFLESGTLTAGAILMNLVFTLFFGVVFATLGAILGVALFQKRPAPFVPPPGPPPVSTE